MSSGAGLAVSSANDCFGFNGLTTACTGDQPPNHGGDAAGDGVDIWANEGGGGQSPSAGDGSRDDESSNNGSSDGGSNNGGSDSGQPLPEVGCADGLACEVDLPPEVPDDTPPPVYVSDLVNFRAATPTMSMEPNGWMIVGLETNFIASASAHVLSGELLGRSAEVRFIPTGYRWSYGDGATATTDTPGASWADLGLREFEPTPTSHIYRSSEDYSLQLEVLYRAEYRFAGYDWQNIDGTVITMSAPMTARAVEAKTVLVERDCRVARNGPGC